MYKQPTEYSKVCPQCGVTQYYKSKDGLNISIKKNSRCAECGAKNRRGKRIYRPKFVYNISVNLNIASSTPMTLSDIKNSVVDKVKYDNTAKIILNSITTPKN